MSTTRSSPSCTHLHAKLLCEGEMGKSMCGLGDDTLLVYGRGARAEMVVRHARRCLAGPWPCVCACRPHQHHLAIVIRLCLSSAACRNRKAILESGSYEIRIADCFMDYGLWHRNAIQTRLHTAGQAVDGYWISEAPWLLCLFVTSAGGGARLKSHSSVGMPSAALIAPIARHARRQAINKPRRRVSRFGTLSNAIRQPTSSGQDRRTTTPETAQPIAKSSPSILKQPI